MIHAQNLPGRIFHAADGDYLYFSGTSYLGISTNPEFQELLQQAFSTYGTNFGSSRHGNVQIDIFDQAESYLAYLTGAEAALTVSSGLLAGQLVVRSLQNLGNLLFAPYAHPAVIIETSNFYSGDFDSWKLQVQELSEKLTGDIILVANSVDALYVKYFNFDWVADLPDHRKYYLLVDDSHGFGLLGKKGCGIYPALPQKENLSTLVISSMGKACGIPGGLILGDQESIQLFRNHPFFGGSSPLVPAYLTAFMKAEHIYEAARKILFKNIDYFKKATDHLNLFTSMIDYPVLYSADNHLAGELEKQRIILSSFHYPTRFDPMVTRVVINSKHTREDLDLLIESILNYSNNRP